MLSAVFGLTGPRLSEREAAFFAEVRPSGFILFSRNIEDPEQVRRLVESLRDTVGDSSAPILIDQEGGRVQRLRPPHWRSAPPAERFAELYERNRNAGLAAAKINARLIAGELAALGVTVNCAPVLDLRVKGAHDIIGDRAYGGEPEQVSALGRAVCDGLLEGGVLPVVKHLPGHGRAREDSHLALPRVDCGLEELRASDFKPFAALKDAAWGMTAHIVYDAMDGDRPATQSPAVIKTIREEIGFQGVLVSDDLSMKALAGDFAERAALSLAAGCDLVLHCNGDMTEMTAVAKGCRPLADKSFERVARGEALRTAQAGPADLKMLIADLDRLLAAA